MPLELAFSLSICLPLRAQPRGVQAVGHRDALRMVGDGDVFQPALACGRDHFFQRALPSVAVVCMCRSPTMSSSSISCGKRAGGGPIELEPGFAQSRAESRQIERGVDVFFGPAGDVSLVAAEHAVFVDLQPAALGHAAQHDVVFLRAGEVLQRRAEALGRHDAQIDLQAAGSSRTDILVSPRAITSATPSDRRRSGPSPVRLARRRRPADRDRRSFRVRGDNCRPLRSARSPGMRANGRAATARSRRLRPNRCARAAVAASARPARIVCFGLGAKALQLADAMRFAGGAQFVERGDVQFLEQHGRFLRPQARHAQQLQHRGRHLGGSARSQRQLAGRGQRA